jgi:thiol-disulfide isomerase/thioredoxin
MNVKKNIAMVLHLEKILLVMFAVVLLALVPLTPETQPLDTTTFEDRLLKDVTVQELQDIVSSYEGEKAVLINVWATWCAPCVEEFPYIVKLQRNYPDRLKVIFVSADFSDSRDRALEFLKEQEVDWTTYFKVGNDQEFIASLSEKWTGALPFTKVIDRTGNTVASWERGADYQKFEKHVKTAIKP